MKNPRTIRRVAIPALVAAGCAAAVAAALDRRSGLLLAHTLWLAAATVAVSLPAGTLLAVGLVRTDLPGRRPALWLLALLLLIPLYLQAAAWQAGFGLQGWYTALSGARPPLERWTAVIWIHSLAAIPWVTLIVAGGLRLVEPELEEQALLDGSAAAVLWHVTLRRAAPALGAAALWVALNTATEMTVTDLFAVRTYAEEVYTHVAVGDEPGDLPLRLLPGTLLTLGLAAAGMLLAVMLAPRDRPVRLGPAWTFRLGRLRWPAAAALAAALLLIAGVPLGNLVYQAGKTVTQQGDGLVRTWSAAKCAAMIVDSPRRHPSELNWSLLTAALAATAAVALALGLAWLARRRGLRVVPLVAAIALGLAVPGPIVGVAIIGLLNRPDWPLLLWLYDRSITAPWLAMLIRSFPVAGLITWYAVNSVPEALLEAAAVDGAGPVRRLASVALPLMLPALAAAWLVALAVALGELSASILVTPPGMMTLSIRVFGLLHYGVEDRVAGICLALIAASALLAALAGWLVTQRPGRR